MDNFNTDLFRSRVDTIILRVLQEEDRYVYEILDLIYKNSVSHYEIKQSTLYNSMKRLESSGLVTSYEGAETNGAKRKYYSLTEKGKHILNKEKEEWEYTRTLLNKLVSDKEIDLASVDTPPYNASSLKPLTPRTKTINPTTETELDMDSDKIDSIVQDKEINSSISVTQSSLENAFLEKTREKASEILGLGNFEPIKVSSTLLPPPENNSPTLSSLGSQNFHDTDKGKYLNYREALGAIFEEPETFVLQPPDDLDSIIEINNHSDTSNISTSSHHFNDMKQTLVKEGFRIKIYSKANSSNFYYMNYYYSNKLMRDSTLITYILFFVGLMFFAIYKKEIIPWVILSFSTIIPILVCSIWKQNPEKRIRTKNNSLSSIIIGLSIYIILAGIVFSFSFIYKINYITYPTYIFLICIPLFTIIKTALYRSKKYHLKK